MAASQGGVESTRSAPVSRSCMRYCRPLTTGPQPGRAVRNTRDSPGRYVVNVVLNVEPRWRKRHVSSRIERHIVPVMRDANDPVNRVAASLDVGLREWEG